MTVNERIKEVMKTEGLNYNSLGKKLNTSDTTVRNIIKGRNKPGYDFLINIIQTFDWINTEWLITGKGKMREKQTIINEPETIYKSTNPKEQRENNINQKREINGVITKEIDYLKALLKEKDSQIEKQNVQIKEKDSQIKDLLTILKQK